LDSTISSVGEGVGEGPSTEFIPSEAEGLRTGLGTNVAVGVGGGAVAVDGGDVMAGGIVASAVGEGMAAGEGVTPQPARTKTTAMEQRMDSGNRENAIPLSRQIKAPTLPFILHFSIPH
jgi:hypothetical protein